MECFSLLLDKLHPLASNNAHHHVDLQSYKTEGTRSGG